ncbi:DHH family phosphoesterase [Helicobacter turcicus]|uniref:3',5'-cyclic-nucleotide phosphodiesterase n=1 Tax=Helicobacter turcicus TaxID=2867412 RepID=A0ABS7JM03_9HELI|nr:3',5'-cyclic-nucleotide phosphodiesterase [Helicobacter turcicus]MBX7490423.1 3',5'-cyclic-nucleotide phosphodiesterase [Helicobacter turcicus]MBX7545282.1 3',5'-cyclic-nucleotide phosphodiesterase [Helicobacter turcicus]
MEVYHLSHIDLDGYGCQMVSNEFYKSAFKDCGLHYFNANYGREVGERLEQIYKRIKAQNIGSKAHILVSDLNLTLEECEKLAQVVLELNLSGFSVTFELLDHHKSGQECAQKYVWYVLDTKRCATKIVYDTLLERYGICDSIKAWLEPMVEMINSIDLWLEDTTFFEFGKVAMRLIVEAKELNRFMFDDEDREYKLALLRESVQFLSKSNGHILLDNAVLEMKKRFLKGSLLSDTLDNLISKYQSELLAQKAESCSVCWGKYRGFLSYSIGNISVLANLFLKNNPQFDFFVDVSARGNVSLRANNACDVSLLAKECFNGGGHPNASGGKIEGFKESFVYADIKASVQGLLETLD